jgi:hypothetical protein
MKVSVLFFGLCLLLAADAAFAASACPSGCYNTGHLCLCPPVPKDPKACHSGWTGSAPRKSSKSGGRSVDRSSRCARAINTDSAEA